MIPTYVTVVCDNEGIIEDSRYRCKKYKWYASILVLSCILFSINFLDVCGVCAVVCVCLCVWNCVCALLADIALWSKMAQSQGSVITSSPFIKSPCTASVLLKSPSIPHDTCYPATTHSHSHREIHRFKDIYISIDIDIDIYSKVMHTNTRTYTAACTHKHKYAQLV